VTDELKAKYPKIVYKSTLILDYECKSVDDIMKDVPRTFSSYPEYSENKFLKVNLKNVLVAYSKIDTVLGYT
jgi:hypothetical protein